MIQIGVSTQLFGNSLLSEEHLRMVREAGFRVLEVFAAPGHFEWQDAGHVALIAEATRALGLSVFSVHAPWAPGQDIAAADAAQREASLQAAYRSVDALLALGGRVLVLHPGAAPSERLAKAEQLRLARQSIAAVAAYCSSRGVTVALENPPPYELAGASADILALYRDMTGEPSIQACFDTGHGHVCAEGVALVSRIPQKIALVHISDNHGESDEHLPPGAGTIPWPHFFALLRERRFDGCLMLELTDLPEPQRLLAEGWDWMNRALQSVSVRG